jgi:hypothetical protein
MNLEKLFLQSTWVQMIKRYKKPTVQLTSLLDLLFCMIFVSLLQTKNPPNPQPSEAKIPEKSPPVISKKIEKPEPPKVPLIRSVSAIFHFHKTPNNPGLPSGSYAMSGTFETKTRAIKLGGVNWIDRPAGYDMVPLNGVISEDGHQLTGRIEFQDCQTFTLTRTSQQIGKEIAGRWVGVYDCLQGETGLTLTIH